MAPSSGPPEPIAIIGMGCRFPGGANTPEAFWELLASGGEALRDVPASRWDVDAYYDPEVSVPGKMYVRLGSYLDDGVVEQFDPQFFGISGREADRLDPQQRLLLEVSWEALEHAGMAPATLKGSQTGIFVGQYWDDYGMQRIYATAPGHIDRYAQLSALRGLSAGRIAHVLDVHGPAMQVDTACSSALLAVHLACQSLRQRESDLALAGGVSLILAPEHLIGICQMQALSPDGRCKTFDARADGFGQGEGCGIVALKRLSDATRDGDRILALIRGSAVNHDGHSRTVTTPSGSAQRALLRQALDNAGVEPHQLGYVEAHGTGTPLGDPIEVLAIARVLCQDRQQPLYIGSAKTNVGHLDAAAGVAGLMKAVLSLQHGAMPPHLHFTEPNPRIPWDDWPIRVPTELTPWHATQKIAGVSAFGMSGTNVHVIVEQAPEAATGAIAAPPHPSRPQHVLTLSAQDQETLHDLAQAYLTHLQTPAEDRTLADMCFTAATGRSHFQHRLAVVADSPEAVCHELTGFLDHGHSGRLFTDQAGRKPPKIAFLFTGQGAQYAGMGRHLYETQPTFRFWLERCADILDTYLDKPLLDVLWSGDAIDQTAYTQPALFALEYALVQVWRSWGIEPDVVMGHSVGEYAAACVAEVFTLEEGLELMAARGRLMQSLPAGGAMVSVQAGEAVVDAHLAPYRSEVAIAAINGPQRTVISGREAAIQRVVETLHAQAINTTPLKVSHAFHSPLMGPILEAFAQVAEQITYAAPSRAIVSNVTGQEMTGDLATADYWVRHLRQAVRFADGMTTLQEMNIDAFVEIGPKPTLLGMGRGCLPPAYDAWLPSLRPEADWATLLASVAQLYVRGAAIDWAGFDRDDAPRRRNKVVLPTYPWRRQRYWTDVVASRPAGPMLHPLLHRRLASALKQVIYESQLSVNNPAYLADHGVLGQVVLPASAYLEMALIAGRSVLGSEPLTLSDVSMQQALVLEETPRTVQLILTPDEHVYHFEVFSLANEQKNPSDETWIRHASGRISLDDAMPKRHVSHVDVPALQAQYPKPVDLETYNQCFTERGMAYGPAFQALDALYHAATKPGAALAHVRLPKAATIPGEGGVYHLHPVLLDACLRVSEALFQDLDADRLYLPCGVTALHVWAVPKGAVWVQATGTQPVDSHTRVVDLQLFDEDGARVAAVDGLTLRAASVAALQRRADLAQQSSNVWTDWLYQLTWQSKSQSASQSECVKQSGTWLILADERGVGRRLAEQLEQQHESCLLAFAGSGYRQVAPNRYQLNPAMPSEFEQLLTDALPRPPAGVIHLWGLSAREDAYLLGVGSALHLVQALNRTGTTAPLWLVTTGAQAVEPVDQSPPSVWQTPLWGLGRVIQAEYPELACVCVDLGPEAQELPLLVHALHSHDSENQIAFRQGQRYVARLTRATLVKRQLPSRIRSDSSYLITGGLGALGLQMAAHLVAAGARHLLLTGRRGVTTPAQQLAIQRLEAEGTQVQVIKADVSNPEDVARLLQRAIKPLRGVLHAAGILDDGMLMQQTTERFAHVAAPKVQGAWHLHTQTLGHPLDFFVLFSSVASLMGSAGQANYAAANAFMDGLAHYRRAGGRPALAINWGPWGEVGMAAAEPVKRRLAHAGWGTITSQQGWQITQALLQHEMAQAGVLPIDWATFVQQVPGAAQSPVLSDITEPVRSSAPQLPSQEHPIMGQLQTASPIERQRLLVAYLQERAAQILQVSLAQLDEQASLHQLGMDSLIAVELRTWVRNDLDVDVPVERFLTTPTIRDLAAVINNQLTAVSPSPSQAPVLPTSDWITYPRPNPQARVRLFCFPYAGGGASVFRDWADALPSEIELCPIQLPGREERLQEDPFTDLSSLVDALLPVLRPHLDTPFAFFGHSMGAMIGYEVTRQLRTQYAMEPVHLLISSRSAPQLANTAVPLRFLPAPSFMDELQRLYGAVPEVIQQNAELQDVFLPILRADVTLLETHAYVPGEPLNCPITVFGGEQDQSVTHAALAAWREHTRGAFTQHILPGDHFYINHAWEALAKIIMQELSVAVQKNSDALLKNSGQC
jgi:acyl transferase domain-containing protein/surfactin synthase thioesterase subunit/acyl carrier protein